MRRMVKDAILTEPQGVKVAGEAVAVEDVVEETIVATVIQIAMVHRK